LLFLKCEVGTALVGCRKASWGSLAQDVSIKVSWRQAKIFHYSNSKWWWKLDKI